MRGKIKTRIISGFSILIALFFIFCLLVIREMSILSGLTSTIISHPLQVSNAALRAQKSIIEMHYALREAVVSGSPEGRRFAAEVVEREEKLLVDNLDLIRGEILGEEGKRLERKARKLFEDWETAREETLALAWLGRATEAALLLEREVADSDRLEGAMQDLYGYARKKAQSFMTDSERVEERAFAVIFLAAASCALIAVLIAVFTLRSILAGIDDLKRTQSALQAEELFTEAALDSQQDTFFAFDLSSGKALRWNRAFSEASGYTDTEIASMKAPGSWYGEEDLQRAAAAVEEISRKGKAVVEMSLITKSGKAIPFEYTAAFIKDRSGRRQHMISIGRDITERQRTEKRVRGALARTEAILVAVPDIITEVDNRKVYTWSNRAGLEFFGDDMVGREAAYYFEGEQETYRRVQSLFEGKEDVIYIESWQRRRDGEVRLLAWWCRVTKDEESNVTGALSTARDITDQRRDEEALRLSEERLAMAFDAATDGIYDWNLKTQEAFFSPRYYTMLGYEADELPPTFETWQSLLHPEDLPGSLKLVEELSRGAKDSYDMEVRMKTKSGDWKWVLSRGRMIERDPDGGPVRLIGTHTDITERKMAEQERLHLEGKILRAQKLESLGVLAGGIAHDFNNLLVGILGNADLAMNKTPAASPAMEYLGNISKTAERAAELANQMLAYSGKGKFLIEKVSINSIVQEMSRLLKVSMSKGTVLRLDFAPDLPIVEVDVSQIRQVVMNLITNASEAIGEGDGIITMKTGIVEAGDTYQDAYLADPLKPGSYVFLEISDTGCGMDEETKARLFEPFFTTKFTGRGLGMAAVQGIIRGHNGAVMVYSEEGKGTTFRILLPVDGRGKAVEKSEGEKKDDTWKGSGTVLVVDDEEVVLQTAESMLHELGYKVLTAKDGKEGVEIFKEWRREISAVLLDVTMPRMNGEEAFQEMHRIDRQVRVILSSGYSEQSATASFAGKGLAGFIQKPYKMSTLQELLKKLDTA